MLKTMKRSHIMVLTALCLSIGASVGLITSIGGLFITPIAEEFGVGRGSASLNMTLVNLICALGGTLMPRLMKKKNYKLLVWVFVALTVGATVLLSMAKSLWLMYVLNAIRGFSTGFLGLVAATVIISNWFHRNTAVITSIAMAFSGVAGAVFTPIFSSIIEKSGWRTGYLISAIFMLVLYLPILLFKMSLDPGDIGQLAYGEVEGVQRVRFGKEHLPKAQDKIPVWLFVIAALFASLAGFVPSITPHFTGIAVFYGFTAAVGAAMLSITMVINTAGKLLLGFLIDRLGVRRSMLIYLTATLVGIILILTVRSVFIFYLASALIGFSSATCTLGLAMTCREAFGITHYTSTYPKISLFCTVIYAFATTINGLIYDIAHSYTPIFWVMLACMAIMYVCIFIITERKRI